MLAPRGRFWDRDISLEWEKGIGDFTRPLVFYIPIEFVGNDFVKGFCPFNCGTANFLTF